MRGELKIRSECKGMNLSDYLKKELGAIMERPTLKDWLQKVANDEPVVRTRSAADLIRDLRDLR